MSSQNLAELHTSPTNGQDTRPPTHQAQQLPSWSELTPLGTPRPIQGTSHKSSDETYHIVSQCKLMLRGLRSFQGLTGPRRGGASFCYEKVVMWALYLFCRSRSNRLSPLRSLGFAPGDGVGT